MKTKHDVWLTRADNSTYHLWGRRPAPSEWEDRWGYHGGLHWLDSFVCSALVKKYFGLKRQMRCGSKRILRATIEIEIKE